jgi:hypothetical protein
MAASLTDLTWEYERSLVYTESLVSDLSQDEIHWRSGDDASAIGWHLGHQAAVAHFMVRNLTSAEAPVDAELDSLMDSATAERDRGALPDVSRLESYRSAVAERVRFNICKIDSGNVGAPAQLRVIAHGLLIAVINHEYQHSKWIGEVRAEAHGKDMPGAPVSEFLTELDGYQVVHV